MQKKHYYLLLVLALAVYIINLFVDVMAIDASQYAEMSWEMLSTKSFLKVHSFGADYLDKPPLLFWLSSLSFYLFGAGNVSYKLPSLLFAILSIYSTYRFARIYYTRHIALSAALILATTEALFLITNDVRTDTILMGSVIFAIWQWAQFLETDEAINLIGGSLGIGLALLAKGPIGLIAVAAALLPHILLAGKWKRLLELRLALAVLLIAAMLTPMCLGLYQQWGWHGLKFYFWTQSFGRITGASEWNNNPDPLFLIHTTAWAFLPWSLFLFIGWGELILRIVRTRFAVKEIISISGFTLVLIALMLSRYQLPHYVFVVYPLAAVIAASYFERLQAQPIMKKILSTLQVLTLLVIIAVSCLLQYCLKGADLLSLSCLIGLYLLVIAAAIYISGPIANLRNTFTFLNHKAKKLFSKAGGLSPETHIAFDILYRNLFFLSAAVMIAFSFLMGAFYFPAILRYQPGGDFGRYVHQHRTPDNNFATFHYQYGFSDIFYAQQQPAFVWGNDSLYSLLKTKKHLIIFTNPYGTSQLDTMHIKYHIIQQRYSYPVSKLSLEFLNPARRDSISEKVTLVEADF